MVAILVLPVGRARDHQVAKRYRRSVGLVLRRDSDLLDHVELPKDLGVAMTVAMRVKADQFTAIGDVIEAIGFDEGRGARADLRPVLRAAGCQFRTGVLPEKLAVRFAETQQDA